MKYFNLIQRNDLWLVAYFEIFLYPNYEGWSRKNWPIYGKTFKWLLSILSKWDYFICIAIFPKILQHWTRGVMSINAMLHYAYLSKTGKINLNKWYIVKNIILIILLPWWFLFSILNLKKKETHWSIRRTKSRFLWLHTMAWIICDKINTSALS